MWRRPVQDLDGLLVPVEYLGGLLVYHEEGDDIHVVPPFNVVVVSTKRYGTVVTIYCLVLHDAWIPLLEVFPEDLQSIPYLDRNDVRRCSSYMKFW